MRCNVYLADLRYNYSGVLANDCMPLGVAYMKAVLDRDCPDVESRLFAYPDKLLSALRSNPPDVLMVSNYVWNEALSFHYAKIAKRIRPDMLVVMGGPNISLEPERQIAYFNAHPEIDVYVLGEADFLAREITLHFADSGLSLAKMGDRELPSSIYRRSDGMAYRNETWPRHKEVEEIPSPWLTGIQDEFFDGKLAPMIETNRGCPFTCTFCCQGTSWYTKVHNFSKERIREEVWYIAKKVKEKSPKMGTLRIADSNYGMFERDIEISGFIGEVQKMHGWPTFIDATTGKNRPDRIIKSVEQVSGALVLYQAVQSLDEDVLRNVKRSTIKLEAYEQLQVHMRGRGLRSVSDLILGLPGESLKTHLAALHKLLDSGIESLHNFQAMLLKGSEMETMAARKEFGFQSRFRVLPKNFGVYGDDKVIDIEEIIVGTDTLPFEDYITARKYHLNSSVFWNDSWFQSPLRFVQSFGIKASVWWEAMMQALEQGPIPVQQFLAQFVAETKGELFPTREACFDFYSSEENFAKLQRGEIGDNLMYKYRAIASFHLWPEICKAAMEQTRRVVQENGIDKQIPHFEEFWKEFSEFVALKHAHGANRDEILAPREQVMHYDFEAWLASEKLQSPQEFRLQAPRKFTFTLNEESVQELDSALAVWGCELKGLTKLVTRIRVTSQIREVRAIAEPTKTAEKKSKRSVEVKRMATFGDRALITGASGFIGTALCTELVTRYEGAPLHSSAGDVTSRFDLEAVGLQSSPEVIVHLAQKGSATTQRKGLDAMLETTVQGTVNLLDILKPKRFVLMSSCSVYGNTPIEGVNGDWDNVRPLSGYGFAKALAERVTAYWAAEQGRIGVILRAGNVVGPGCRGLIDYLVTHALRHSSDGVAARMRGDGRIVRDYVTDDYVVRAIAAAMEAPLNSGEAHIFNIGTGRGLTNREVADIVQQVLRSRGIDLVIHWQKDVAAGEPWTAVLAPGRATTELGIEPPNADDVRSAIEAGAHSALDRALSDSNKAKAANA